MLDVSTATECGQRPGKSQSTWALSADDLSATRAKRRKTSYEGQNAVYCDNIEGRFRRISTQQLAMAWWLYRDGHITKRQLRVYFALHEMVERRRYTKGQPGRPSKKPLYRLTEAKGLVGGQGTESATRELSGDLKRLNGVGLARAQAHSVAFATTGEQLNPDLPLNDYWEFFKELPNRRRNVPVPRRTLRALAGGFRKAETAFVVAALIRCVFWHKESDQYRVDGRIKLSWVSETFGVSRRALTGARTHLIELGWLKPLETPQWALNRWGAHDVVVVDWASRATTESTSEKASNTSRPSVGEGRGGGSSARPQADSAGGSASPCLNRYSSSKRNKETRKLGGRPTDPQALVSTKRDSERKPPDIRDVKPKDLSNTNSLLELFRQASASGLIKSSGSDEHAQLQFFSMAHRARTRGERPAAMFMWLVRGNKTEFITDADEDDAIRRLQQVRNGQDDRVTGHRGGGDWGKPVPTQITQSEEGRMVAACLRVANDQNIADPFRVAQVAKGWTREQWDDAHLRYVAERTQGNSPSLIGHFGGETWS